MAAWSSTIERNTPRLSRRWVSLEKKPWTALSQEHDFGVKWKTKRGCRASQAFTLGAVGCVVVGDEVDDLAERCLGLDGVQETDELLMAVALHTATDHLAFEHVEGGKQRGRAAPLLIMRHGAGSPLLHRQTRLGSVERLDLALLVDRQHDGVRRRIDIEADNLAQLGQHWVY